MSEERILWVFAERRTFQVDEVKELLVMRESRVLDVQEEERVLEVRLP